MLQSAGSFKNMMCYLLRLLVLASFSFSITNVDCAQSYKKLTVATYNLWNVMFTWDARKYFIAAMIKKANPDVIGFQEIRSDLNGPQNQLNELQTLLGNTYKHASYYPVETIRHGPPGWEREGLGVLSKYPIMISHAIDLKLKVNSEDTNKRIIVHMQIDFNGDEIDITLVHLSYNRQQQCQNAVDIINFLASVGSERSIIIGDLNVYEDFPWPVKAILKGNFPKDGGCQPGKYFDAQDTGRGYGYVDAWLQHSQGNHKGNGYTFSNMPHPGLINRPDRILVSTTGLQVVNTKILGGEEYKDSNYYSILNFWYRFQTVKSFANKSLERSRITNTCHQDCGPHGSCRCGVCVKGGAENNCDLQFCYECRPSHYNSFLVLLLLFGVYCLLSLYILFKAIMQHISPRACRRNKKILNFLSNKSLSMLLVLIIFIFYLIATLNFSDILETVFGRMSEEMFPSDHRMVVSDLRITYR